MDDELCGLALIDDKISRAMENIAILKKLAKRIHPRALLRVWTRLAEEWIELMTLNERRSLIETLHFCAGHPHRRQ